MYVLLFGSEVYWRCADLVLLAELQKFPHGELELGSLQTLWLFLQIRASVLPSVLDEPHNRDLFFSLEAHSCSHLISPFFSALWLNISHSCVFFSVREHRSHCKSSWQLIRWIRVKALLNFCRLLCIPFFSEWGETGGSWRLLPFPSDLACNVGSLCMEYGPCYSATVQGLTAWV